MLFVINYGARSPSTTLCLGSPRSVTDGKATGLARAVLRGEALEPRKKKDRSPVAAVLDTGTKVKNTNEEVKTQGAESAWKGVPPPGGARVRCKESMDELVLP